MLGAIKDPWRWAGRGGRGQKVKDGKAPPERTEHTLSLESKLKAFHVPGSGSTPLKSHFWPRNTFVKSLNESYK